jgi:hypothetical protein
LFIDNKAETNAVCALLLLPCAGREDTAGRMRASRQASRHASQQVAVVVKAALELGV